MGKVRKRPCRPGIPSGILSFLLLPPPFRDCAITVARNRVRLDSEDDFPRRRQRARRKSRGGIYWVLGGLGFALIVVVVAAIALTIRKGDGSGPPNLWDVVSRDKEAPVITMPYGDWRKPTDTPLDPAWPPEAGLVGEWKMQLGNGKMERWIVRCPQTGKWEVLGFYHDGLEVPGEFVGTDVKVSGRNLSFTQHFDKAPPPPWISGATVTAQLVDRKMILEEGENPPFKGNKVTVIIGGKSYRVEQRKLVFTWRTGENSGTSTMELVERQTPLVPHIVR
jgi:hypothetical protein